MFVTWAMARLNAAGYRVTLADGVPGLFNVEGLARDITCHQLVDLANQHTPMLMPRGTGVSLRQLGS